MQSNSSAGASRYMTLGAALVPKPYESDICNKLRDLASLFKKSDLHCSKLTHNQLVRYSRTVSDFKVLLFGVVSLKATLGAYKEDIGSDDKAYYNKCAQYLLERVGYFMANNNMDQAQLSVCFENGNFNYDALRGLISKCRRNPIHENTKYLSYVNPEYIKSCEKSESPLLQLGDLVAHAIYRCFDDDPSHFGVKEPRYLYEMRKRFFSNPLDGKVCNYGIFPVHKLDKVKPDPVIRTFFQNLSAAD